MNWTIFSVTTALQENIPFSTHIILEKLWFSPMSHVHCEHKAINLKQRPAYILIYQSLQLLTQAADADFCTTAILRDKTEGSKYCDHCM